MSTAEDRTELPTPQRRQELRRRGQIARSGDLTAAVAILASAAALHFFGSGLTISLAQILRASLAAPAWNQLDSVSVTQHLAELTRQVARGTLPILALLTLAAVAVNVAQVGFLMTTEPLVPDLNRLNPLAGLQRILAWRSGAALVTSLLKLTVLSAIIAGFVVSRLSLLLHAGDLETGALAGQAGAWLIEAGFQLSIGLVVLAVADYGLQLWKYEREIRMTRQELRDELRQMDGDPSLRQRRRETRHKLVEARQLERAGRARVLLVDGAETAVAIDCAEEQPGVPLVVASGTGDLGRRLRQAAIVRGVPIVEKGALARGLERRARAAGPVISREFQAEVREALSWAERMAASARRSA